MITTRVLARGVSLAALLWLGAGHVAADPLDQARELLSGNHYAEAATALSPIVAANPYDGEAVYYYAVSLGRSGHCAQAAPYFDTALALGVNSRRQGMRSSLIRAAECDVALGNLDRAEARLRTAWAHWGLDDVELVTGGEAFAPLRASGRLAQFTGRTAAADAGDGAAQRRADLAYFDRLVREVHPNGFHAIAEARWAEAVRDLAARANTMSAIEFNAELMRLAALVGDGHTAVFPVVEGDHAWRLLPIYTRRVADGWIVAAAAPQLRELVGGRLMRVGGRPFDEAFADISRYVASDNDETKLWLGGVALQSFEAYRAIGVAGAAFVEVEAELANGQTRTFRLEPIAVDRDPNARTAPADWPASGSQAAWLATADQPFAARWIADARTVYAQVNQVADAEGHTLEAFGAEVLTMLRRRHAARLIIDLRHNNGGDVNLVTGFLNAFHQYAPLHREAAVVVLIGPRTFSAAMGLAGALERDFDAVFIGWPTGGRPNVYATERPFRLPYSGITGIVSARWHQDGQSGDDARPWIAPDVAVWPTRADLAAGRDPVLDAALRYNIAN